ncbi:unnamed protein product [Symbiodinium microadriaticum]|nr:unnamed protein product [Symbiodinium microadriaticum]
MYEATAGCINDVFQAMDDVMRKENSLFQEHTAVVARAVKDLEETFRKTLASHKQMFESSGFSHVTYFNDILRLQNDLHSNLHEHILPALRFLADHLQALSQSEQSRDSAISLLNNTLALHLHSVDKLTQPTPPPEPAPEHQEEQQDPLSFAAAEVILNDGTPIPVQADEDDLDLLSERMWQGCCAIAFLGAMVLLFRSLVDSRLVKMQQSLIAAMCEHMQEADAGRQRLRAHLEGLLEQHATASLTPGTAQNLLDETRSQLTSRLDDTPGEVIERLLQKGPEYLKNNLVHGIQYVLQAQPNPDDGSLLTHLRRMYLSLQPTRILAQNAQGATPPSQATLEDLQTKVNSVIDILVKLQIDTGVLADAAGPTHAGRVTADLDKLIAYVEQLFERHDNHKDRATETSSQIHAVMNHVKQANGLSNSCLNQVNQVSNTQWSHGDLLAALQETQREHDERLKKHSEALSKIQGQLEKIIVKLTPPMPTKAPPPPAPGSTPSASTTAPSTPTPPAQPAQAQAQPAGMPQACAPPTQGTPEPPIIRLSDQMGPRQPLQLFENLGVASRWQQPSFDARDPRAQQALAYLFSIFNSQ